MVDLHCASMDSPVGQLTCICNSISIIRLLWASDNEAGEMDHLSHALGGIRFLGENSVTETVRRELASYFAGRLRAFTVRPSFVSGSSFARGIWRKLAAVPYGQAVSYEQLSTACGISCARAVGQALGKNPVPIFIPCHRILRSDGKLGGFSGGRPAKRLLLRLEGIAFTEQNTAPRK